MKKHIFITKLIALLLIIFSSCEDVLDKDPIDRYSDASVWADVNLADAFLKNAYRRIYHGYNSNANVSSIADDIFFIHIYGTDIYLQGNITADNQGTFEEDDYRTINWMLFENVQTINTFLSKIDEVANAYPETQREGIKERTDILKGEALFLRAWCYGQMLRTYGGLPIMSEPWEIGEDYLSVERGTFEETVNFIVNDCDAAAGLLKSKSEMESGRATKAAALALKSRILLFAASDLTADGTAESEYVGYKNPNRTQLWTAAKNAAKEVIDLGENRLSDFGAPDKDEVANNYFGLFKETTLGNPEIIWGKMFVADVGDRHRNNRQNGPNGLGCYGSNNPTQSMINSYQMEDGSDFFDHFYIDENNFIKNRGNTKYKNENPYVNREPRFYGSVLCDSSIWQKRFPDLAPMDPLGIYSRRTIINMQGGSAVSTTFGLDTRNGPIESWNASYTGYLVKKLMDDTIDRNDYNTNIWIYFRYAEIILNYAEACMELGENEIAAEYINMIRTRSALPDFEGDIKAALRHERKIELFYEDHRWYDIRRWKILEEVLTNADGIDITQVNNLDNGTTTTTWKVIEVQTRNPVKKMYWIPIPNDEMKKAPQLVQNPGY